MAFGNLAQKNPFVLPPRTVCAGVQDVFTVSVDKTTRKTNTAALITVICGRATQQGRERFEQTQKALTQAPVAE